MFFLVDWLSKALTLTIICHQLLKDYYYDAGLVFSLRFVIKFVTIELVVLKNFAPIAIQGYATTNFHTL